MTDDTESVLKDLEAICTFWGVDYETTLDNPPAALNALIALYGVPFFTTQAERSRVIGKIGLDVKKAFTYLWHPFNTQFAMVAGLLQAWPQAYEFLLNTARLSNAELIKTYHSMQKAKKVVATVAMTSGGATVKGALDAEGSATRAVRAGLAEAIETGSVRSGAGKASETFRKPDPLKKAIDSRINPRAKPVANIATGLFTAVLVLMVGEANTKLAILKKEGELRYGIGKMTDAEYVKMFSGSPYEFPEKWETTLEDQLENWHGMLPK